MAELFYYADEDGDRLSIVDAPEIAGWQVAAKIGDGKGWRSAVYLDRDAALRLADALLKHFTPAAGPVEGQLLIEDEHG